MQGQKLNFLPSPVVAERLRALGRTEDVMFSPDQTRLAIAGFTADKILVIQIGISTVNDVLSVRSDGCVELRCPDFKRPHGISWIDDATLVVANRGKDAIIVPVPAISEAGEVIEVEPLLRFSETGDGLIKSPGSVVVTRLTDQHFDCLVCNNYRHYVSRHIIRRKNGFDVLSSHRLFEHGLKVPDSIAVSTDGGLVAVSNHHGKRIDVFRNDADSAPTSPPVFSLGVPNYPHGVRFVMQDRLVLVADAGAPHVHVYARTGLSWESARGPDASLRVMDDESFQRGRSNPEEGGPKGLDILADGSLLVISCEEVPIAFFDFQQIRDQLVSPALDKQEFQPADVRMLETTIAAMKGQRDQIAALHAENAKLKAMRDRSLDRRILRWMKRLAQKAIGPPGKK